MESECENTRRWLLQAERYEDVKRFDSSAEDRERFCKERGSYHHHGDMVMIETKIPKQREEQNARDPDTNIIEMMQKRIDHLEEVVKAKDDIIDNRDFLIIVLRERLRRANRL